MTTRRMAISAKITLKSLIATSVLHQAVQDQADEDVEPVQVALPLGQRVVAVDGADRHLAVAQPAAADLLDELRGDLHAIHADVDLLQRRARKSAQPALRVGGPHAEDEEGDDVEAPVADDAIPG